MPADVITKSRSVSAVPFLFTSSLCLSKEIAIQHVARAQRSSIQSANRNAVSVSERHGSNLGPGPSLLAEISRVSENPDSSVRIVCSEALLFTLFRS